MFRQHLVLSICVLCFSVQALGQEAPKAEEPPKRLPLAVMKAWDTAEKKVQKNREIYDTNNGKALEAFQKEIEKIKPPVNVDEVVRQFQQEAIVALDAGAKPPPPPPPDKDVVVAPNGHRYKIFLENLSWDDAKKRCEDMGGHLLAIEDNIEHTFLADRIGKFSLQHPELPKTWHVWLALRYDKNQKKWFTLDGRIQTFSVWIMTHPDDERGVMRQNGNWFSSNGKDRLDIFFICEWDK